MPALGYRNGDIKGYVIGIKQFNTSTPYKEIKRKVDTHFKPVFIISGLEKFTKYLVNIRAYNSRGAGPTSEDVSVLTLEDGMLLRFDYSITGAVSMIEFEGDHFTLKAAECRIDICEYICCDYVNP